MKFLSYKKLFMSLFGFVLTSFFLWEVFKNVDYHYLKSSILNINLLLFFISIIFIFFAYLIRIYRWQLMINNKKHKFSLMYCSGPFMACYALNNILPFRMGDFARAFYFNNNFNLTSGEVTGFMIIEKLIDFTVIISLLLISILFFKVSNNETLIYLLIFTFLFVIPLSFVVFSDRALISINKITTYFFSFFSIKISNLISIFLNQINVILISFRKAKIFYHFFLLTFLSWICEGLVYLVIAYAIPMKCNALNSLLVFPIGTLSTMIPSAPGYIGTFHYSISKSLQHLDCNIIEATILAVVVHFIIWFSAILWGGMYFISIVKNNFKSKS